MLLKDIVEYLYGNVIIYIEEGTLVFKDLYHGKLENIPSDLLQRKVEVILAKRKGLLDIKVM